MFQILLKKSILLERAKRLEEHCLPDYRAKPENKRLWELVKHLFCCSVMGNREMTG